MRISDPQAFLKSLDKETLIEIEDKFGGIEKFLKLGDKFRFCCNKSGQCCKNRYDSPILLSPYDAFRIQKGLDINTEEFSMQYAEKVLGADSQLPIMLLRFPETGENHDQCVFLGQNGCGIYENRPLVCRMYPVGRIIDLDMNSYFFLTKTADYCNLGKGTEYTLEEWLDNVKAIPYLEWSDRFHSLYMEINFEKYHSLDLKYKAAFGDILYDFELSEKIFPGDSKRAGNPHSGEDDNPGPHLNYEVAKMYIDRFLK